MPENISVNGINKAISPKAWKKKSAVKLPLKPSKFLILVLFGKIKLGSSGEKVARETSKRRPIITRAIPAVSIILFMPKLIVLLANFLNSINK